MDVASKPLPARTPDSEPWRDTLAQIPTVFGRLVYLASLRDPGTNRYSHFSQNSGDAAEDADRSLCQAHHRVFQKWIGYSLAEQKADLDDYVRESGGRQSLVQQYRNLPPPAAREVERQLYLTDLETLIGLLRHSPGGGYAVPGS